ncbi:MAG: hypothetical protein IPJ25_08025 [Rhodocyclaceae bacterium]|nr:hypothetical protein [Rhodocyclaceae bacterium]MBL0075209.1 hypothetical protein [Rhodocyclaceae bacterium]
MKAPLAISLAALALAAPCISYADVTANLGVVSDYRFRGVSQTHEKAALQGGVDYSNPNGFYAGAWLSTITWVKDFTGKGSTEVDLYGGYKNAFAGGDWNYDVGAITYIYPGKGAAVPTILANPNTTELYGALGYKWLTVKYSHTVSSNFVGWYGGPAYNQDTKGSGYLEANATYDLGNGWGLTGHVGHQKVKNSVTTAAALDASYTDWKLGVTKDVGFGVVGLAYSDTDATGACSNPFPAAAASSYCWGKNKNASDYKDVAGGQLVLSFLKSF